MKKELFLLNAPKAVEDAFIESAGERGKAILEQMKADLEAAKG